MKKFDILLVFMFDRLGRKENETSFVVDRSRSAHRPMQKIEQYPSIPFQMLGGCVMSRSV